MNENDASSGEESTTLDSESPPNSGPTSEAPKNAEAHKVPFFERLRRSKDNQMVGGVSTGLGRELGIDPLIIRVTFVMLAMIGGAGFILYAAAWMLIPVEGSNIGGIGKEFKAQNDVQVRTIGMVAAAVIAAFAALGSAPWFLGGWSNGSMWFIASIAITAGLIYWIISASRNGDSGSSWSDFGSYNYENTPAQDATMYSHYSPTSTATPVTPRNPKDPTAPMLFMLTVSIGAIVLGGLALWASLNEALDPKVYLAVALGVTALGTFVGIRWGKPGPLIALGTVLSAILIASSIIPSVNAGQIDLSPASISELQKPITLGMGEIAIDLRKVDPASEFEGETITLTNGIGRVEVIVPEGVDVEVNGTVRVGQIDIFGINRTTTSFGVGQTGSLQHQANGPNPLTINASTTIGEIKVIRK